MLRFLKSIVGGTLGAAALVALTAQAPAQAAEVNLYSSRHYQTDEELYKDFTKATGIKVNVIQAGGSDLIQRLQREGRNSPADVFLTEDAGVIGRADVGGLLQPVKSAALEKAIPPNLREPNGNWFGFTQRARVIMYHKDRVQPAQLSTYEDLADPKWKGKILIRSSSNAYNQSLVASLMQAHGAQHTEQWAKGIVANMARAPQGGDRDQITAMLAGEGDIVVSNTYYLGHLMKDDPKRFEKVGVFFPNQNDRGTHVNVSGGGVTRYAPNKDNAVKFLEFLATAEAQKVFAEANFEYPVRVGVPMSPVIAAWGTDFKRDPLNVGVLAKTNAEAVRLMDRAGWK
jgi:iron(III) transport system substrate-binding protein